MYKAILQRKNGNIFHIFIPKILSYIRYDNPKFIGKDIEEYIELNPNNIIDKGGFTEITPAKETSMIFYLHFQKSSKYEDELYYNER